MIDFSKFSEGEVVNVGRGPGDEYKRNAVFVEEVKGQARLYCGCNPKCNAFFTMPYIEKVFPTQYKDIPEQKD